MSERGLASSSSPARREREDGMSDPSAVLSTCPKCETEQEDHDGFGVLICDECGYCSHPDVYGGVCRECGKEPAA